MQGKISKISSDRKVLTVDLFDGYPGPEGATNNKIEIYNSKTNELKTSTYYGVRFAKTGSRQLSVTKQFAGDSNFEQVGDIAVVASTNL